VNQTVHLAKFSVGELIHHKLFDYRGVIIDVDQDFQAPDEWYEQVAKSRPPKDKPWYHVLVDDSEHTTYVAEQNLESDIVKRPIHHPLLGYFFLNLENGKYISNQPTN